MAEIGSAYVSILPSARGFGGSLNSQVGPQVGKAGTGIGASLGKSMLKGFIAIGVGVKVAQFLGDSLDEAREAQKVGAATEQLIKTTGGAANVTADQVGKLTSAISAKVGIDDEAIQSGANLLLTFKNVRNEAGKGNDVFNRATKAATDLSVQFGGMDGASKQLGKALNDPVKGTAALSKAGVQFTQTQKDQIAAFVESGDILKAQKIILGEVESQVGGVAAASATAGEKAGVAFGNLKEQIGTALLPVIDTLANTFTTKIAPAISGFVTGLTSGSGAAGGFSGFIRNNVLPVLSDIGTFITTKAVPAIRDALGKALQSGKEAFDSIRQAIADNKPEVDQIVRFVKRFAETLYTRVIPAAIEFAGVVTKRIGKAISVGIDVVSALVRAYNRVKDTLKSVATTTGNVIGKVKELASTAKEKAGNILEATGRILKEGFAPIRQSASAVKQVVVGVFNAISTAIQGAIDKVETLIQKLNSVRGKGVGVKGGSGGKDDLNRTAGRSVAESIAGGITARGDLVTNALDGLFKKLSKKAQEKLKKLRGQLATVRDDFASLVDPIASNFTQGLFDFDNAGAFAANLNTVKGTLSTLLSNFKTLISNGLNPGFLYQLFQSGGPALINSLAGLPAADAQAAGSLFGQVTDLSNQLGTAVAGSTAKGAELEAQTVRLEKAIAKLEKSGTKNTREFAAAVNGAAADGRRNGRGGRR